MGRYENRDTGVVVNVDDKTAEQLDATWEPAGQKSKPASRSK